MRTRTMFVNKSSAANLNSYVSSRSVEYATNRSLVTNYTNEIKNSNLNIINVTSLTIPNNYEPVPLSSARTNIGKYSNIGTGKNSSQRKKHTGCGNSANLSIKAIQKILTKLVVKAKLSKEELASKLQITTTSLSNLMNGGSAYLIPKINFELVKIYCETDFYNNLKKNENSHIHILYGI